MAKIELSEDLAYSFIGALISIARVDGAVNVEESQVLREIAGEITAADDFDFEFALTNTLSVSDFAQQLRGDGQGPFRGVGAGVSAEQVAQAFLDAAERVAGADDGSSGGEDRLIRTFKDTFGLS